MDSSVYADAGLYDAQYGTLTKDVRFYRDLAVESGGPVLELAVGTGRIAAAIVKEGIALTGIDASPEMLEAARAKFRDVGRSPPFAPRGVKRPASGTEGRPRLLIGDFRNFDLGGKFPLIICGFNALHHVMRQEELLDVFRCVRRHLEPGGAFAFDLFHPRLERLRERMDEAEMDQRFFDERCGLTCEIWATYTYDRATQIKRCVHEYRWADGRIQRETLTIRIFFPEELMELVKSAGLDVERRLGDFDGSAFSEVSPKQILVCRASSVHRRV